ncbi:MAG: isoprenyl transferase [Bdellovibrionales bacterium]|nr:isoprenyl transferase [Bdellovibrionales bacterium]
MQLPKHVAIIMDGNGRWAKARGHNRFFGHIRGAKRAKQIIEECARLNVQNLTLFTFSTENWKRPAEEVNFLMLLLRKRLKSETKNLIKNNIRFHCIGDLSQLPTSVLDQVNNTIEQTKNNTGMNLTFALNYGGRQEIISAVKSLAEDVDAGRIEPKDIDEALISNKLPSSFLQDPDLIIRTSGESRLSNFFLWQAAYAEFYVTPIYWPDFDAEALQDAFSKFALIERRFGMTSEQVLKNLFDGNNSPPIDLV